MLEHAADGQRRGMVAHGGNANTRSVCISEATDGRSSRHKTRVVKLNNWRRKVHVNGSNGIYAHEYHVAFASPEAIQGGMRACISDQPHLNSDASAESASDLYDRSSVSTSPYLSSPWILGVHRQVKRDPNFACLHQVGDSRVKRPWRFRHSHISRARSPAKLTWVAKDKGHVRVGSDPVV